MEGLGLNDIMPWVSLFIAVGGVFGSFAVMKYRVTRLEREHEKDVDELKRDIQGDRIASEHGRRNLSKDLRAQIEKEHDIFTKRIDKTQDDLKEYKTKTDEEFKALNKWMSSIDGKLKIIVDKIK